MSRLSVLGTRALVVAWAVLWLPSGSVAAQSAPGSKPGRFGFGTRFGTSFTELASDYQVPTFPRFAPIVGFYAEGRLASWVSLSADALYTEYGGNGVAPLPLYGTTHPALQDLVQMNLQIRTLEFPLQVKFSMPSVGTSVVPYVSLGGSLATFLSTTSYNFRKVQWGDSTSTAIVRRIQVNMNDAMHSVDYAALGAAGIEVRGRQVWWSLEAFYRLGLSEVNKQQVLGATGYSSNAVGVKVGISSHR